MEDLGLADLWANLPGAADWYARGQGRPCCATAYYPGARIAPAALADGGERGASSLSVS